jgi:hypothetical protein
MFLGGKRKEEEENEMQYAARNIWGHAYASIVQTAK